MNAMIRAKRRFTKSMAERDRDEAAPVAQREGNANAAPAQSPLTNMAALQRTIGNSALQRLIQRQALPGLLQRDDTPVAEAKPPAPATKDDLIKAFKPETLDQDADMKALAGKLTIAEFISLANSTAIALKPTLKALFTYWTPVALTDVEATIKAASADARKTCWSDSALMALAETKLGADPYLTFITHLGMHQAPTTDELGEGGKEHTPAPEADKLIRDKLDAYVTNAVAAGRQIEGQVGVVGSADWDRAGIAHYGEAVWKTGPPPKTPKKDAINGFVDSKGRVWIERNSGNAGTLIHEGIHKYSEGSFLSTLGFNTNEGTTEYFTRLICKELKVERGNYETQFKIIETLVDNVASKEALAAAYFDGDFAALKSAFIKYRKSKDVFIVRWLTSERSYEKEWTSFVAHMKAGDYDKARKLIE
jgi:hypothetical protein